MAASNIISHIGNSKNQFNSVKREKIKKVKDYPSNGVRFLGSFTEARKKIQALEGLESMTERSRSTPP